MRPRDKARIDTIERIKGLARQQLAEVGPAGLSLRAVARDLDLVSSAVYRYVSSRDELLTILIADAYDRLAEAVEAADAACPPDDFAGRFVAVAHAVRTWALEQPAEYGLIYGTPVPGYAAPAEVTVPPATRVPRALAALLDQAHAAGAVEDRPPMQLSAALKRDVKRARKELGLRLPETLLARTMVVWIHLFGAVSFELFGHLHNVVDDKAAWFDAQLDLLADWLGLKQPS